MQTDKYDKNNHQSDEEYGRTAPQMSHCGRSGVVLRGTEDLKEEEVQVHPGITNRGCLASTCRHPLTSAHKHTRTLALTSSRTQSAWANVSPLLQVNPFTRPQPLKTKFPPPAKLRPDHNWVCALNWVYWILLYCCTFIVYRVLAVQLHSVAPHVFICLIPGDDLWNKSRLVLRNVCASYALFMKKWGSVTAGTFAMARHSPGSATATFTTNAFQRDPGKKHHADQVHHFELYFYNHEKREGTVQPAPQFPPALLLHYQLLWLRSRRSQGLWAYWWRDAKNG